MQAYRLVLDVKKSAIVAIHFSATTPLTDDHRVLLVLLGIVEYGTKLSAQANEVQIVLFFSLGLEWGLFVFPSKLHTSPNHTLQTLPYLLVMFQLGQNLRRRQGRC